MNNKLRNEAGRFSKHRVYVLVFMVFAISLLWVSCGPSPPFTPSDPPPSFAFLYKIEYNGVYVPTANGSLLQGNHLADIVGTGFVNLGSTYAFGPTWAGFGQWFTVSGGRWPARWRIASVGGCGQGTFDYFDVVKKTFEVACHPLFTPANINPNMYSGYAPPSLSVSVNPAVAPGGTSVLFYLVEGWGGYILSQQSVTLDASGNAQVNAPLAYDGVVYLVGDLAGNPNGYDGALGTVQVINNPVPSGCTNPYLDCTPHG